MGAEYLSTTSDSLRNISAVEPNFSTKFVYSGFIFYDTTVGVFLYYSIIANLWFVYFLGCTVPSIFVLQ